MNPRPGSSSDRRQGGYLLAEVAITLTLVALLAGTLAGLLASNLEGYVDLRERHAVVASADQALRRMQRDIRQAAPYSLRGTGLYLELLHIGDAARYRAADGIGPNGDSHNGVALVAGNASDRYNLTGRLSDLPSAAGALPGYRAVVYPTSTANLYTDMAANSNIGTATTATNSLQRLRDGDEDQLRLATAHRFPAGSPDQRLYLIDTAVMYICDLGAGTLTRYRGYLVTASPSRPTGGRSDLLLTGVTDCDFTVTERPLQQHLAVASLAISIAGDNGAAALRLLRQVHVVNLP